MSLENIVGKGENSSFQHFPLFPQGFLTLKKQIPSLELYSKYTSANAFNFDKSKTLLIVKEFTKLDKLGLSATDNDKTMRVHR